MDKDTKFIFVILGIIAVLVGVFIWKVVTPQEEELNYTTDEKDINILENRYEENGEDISIEDFYEKIENAAIVLKLQEVLEGNNAILKGVSPFFIIILITTGIVIFIKFKNLEISSKIGLRAMISLFCMLFIFGGITFRYKCITNAIEYSIENETWYLEKDTIKSVEKDEGVTYIYLKNHGKQAITSLFSNYHAGEEVEVLMVKGRFGGKYEISIREIN